jgi:hypothetical protein
MPQCYLPARHITNPIDLTSHNSPTGIEAAQGKVKIDPEILHNAAKVTITGDEIISNFPILEAWKISSLDDKVHFAITFDNGTV